MYMKFQQKHLYLLLTLVNRSGVEDPKLVREFVFLLDLWESLSLRPTLLPTQRRTVSKVSPRSSDSISTTDDVIDRMFA